VDIGPRQVGATSDRVFHHDRSPDTEVRLINPKQAVSHRTGTWSRGPRLPRRREVLVRAAGEEIKVQPLGGCARLVIAVVRPTSFSGTSFAVRPDHRDSSGGADGSGNGSAVIVPVLAASSQSVSGIDTALSLDLRYRNRRGGWKTSVTPSRCTAFRDSWCRNKVRLPRGERPHPAE